MSERMEKLVERREKLVKDFGEKIASYELKGNSSTEGCAYSFHEERVFLYMYFKGINTLFLMADEETLESETNHDPYRVILESQTFDGEGRPTIVVFSEKELEILRDIIDKTTAGRNPLFGLKTLELKVA